MSVKDVGLESPARGTGQPTLQAGGLRLRPAGLVMLVLATLTSGYLLSYAGSGLWLASGRRQVSFKQAPARWHSREFTLPAATREDGVVSWGNPARARAVFAKLQAGKPVRAGAVGGSLTYGRGASVITKTDWLAQVFAWLGASFPHPKSVLRNGAIAACGSEFAAFCVHTRIPEDPDIVFVEYVINNGNRSLEHHHLRSYERLLRRLLALPSAPLVVPVMMYNYHRFQINGVFHWSGESTHATIGLYYQLPWLSVRSMVHHHVARDEDGFQQKQWLAPDRIHPNDRGHRYIADMVIHYLQGAADDAAAAAAAGELEPQRVAPWAGSGQPPAALAPAGAVTAPALPSLPPPMLPGNQELAAELCLVGEPFKSAVVKMQTFFWEDKGTASAPDIWATTWDSRAMMHILLDTSRGTAGAAATGAAANTTAVFLFTTKSYHWVGNAKARCSWGCTCDTIKLRSYVPIFGTQDHLDVLLVSRAKKCLISIITTSDSETTGHFFRVRGLLMSSQAAAAGPLALAEFRQGEPDRPVLPLNINFEDGKGP